jgi:signal transduction histidine kinase/ligand-binding sensor domain-containing protein/CheY-like chemotaxis protein
MILKIQILIKIILLQLLLLIPLLDTFADDLKLRAENFTHFTIEDGLPQNNVRCIEEDQYGILWLCTSDGLVRYDGYEFESISEGADGSRISSIVVREVLADGDNLWIATERGLSLFDLKNGSFKSIKLNIDTNNPESIRSLIKVGNELWIGTKFGIYILAYADNQILNIFKLEQEILARKMILVGEKVIVSNYGKGLIEINIKNKKISRMKIFEGKYSNNIIDLNYYNEKLFISTAGDGLIVLDNKWDIIKKLRMCESSQIKCISDNFLLFAEIYNNEFWIGTQNGINILDPLTFIVKEVVYLTSYIENKYISDSVKSIHFSSSNIWLGLNPGGLIEYEISYEGIDYYLSGSSIGKYNSDSSVYSIARNELNTYIATYKGLFTIEENVNILQPVISVNEQLKGDSIRIGFLCFIDKSNLLIGSNDGLFIYDTLSEQLSRHELHNAQADQRIRSTNCTKDSALASTHSGDVYQYNKSSNSYNKLQIKENLEAVHFIMDSDKLYLGTFRGLKIYKEENHDFTLIDTILNTSIVLVAIPIKRDILIGTFGDGLHLWSVDKRVLSKIELDYQVIGNAVYDIVVIDKHAWISTNNGIVKLNLSTLQYSHYTQAHGLGDKEYSVGGLTYDEETNVLYAGGLTGLTVIDLQKFENNKWDSNQIVSKISIMNNVGKITKNYYNTPKSIIVEEGKTLLLRLGNKDSHHRNKSNFNYKIMKSSSLITTDLRPNQREIALVNISSSDFEILIADGSVFSLKVKVVPYIWKRWWSYLIYLIILMLVLRAIYIQQISIRATKDSEIMSNKELDLKRKQLASLSHELRTPLNAIIGITEATTDAAIDLQHIKSSAHLLRSLIDNALDSISLEMNNSLNLVNSSFSIKVLLNNILEILNLYIISSKIDISIMIDNDVPEHVVTDKIRVQQILLNLVKNALKHSLTATNINIHVSYSDNIIKVSIEDNGIGIKHDEQNVIFDVFYKIDSKKSGFGLGLYISKLISKELGGDLVLESEAGLGCTFIFTFPITLNITINSHLNSPVLKKDERFRSILILEDDPLNIYAIKTQFKNLGFINYQIVSDYEAFTAKKILEYDCIILDLNFGHESLNGIDLAKSLTSSNFSGNIYLLTAEDDILIKQDAMNYVTDYIVKPLSLSALEKIIYL